MRLDTETILVTPAVLERNFHDGTTSADVQPVLKEGIAAAQSGDRSAARRLLFQASGIDPRCEDVWMWLASVSDYPEELLIFLGNALDINPENARAKEWRAATRSLLARTFVQRAAAAHMEGSADRAGQCVEQALAYDAECVLAWLWKASLTDDETQKMSYLEKVLEIDPENPEARSALDALLAVRSQTAFNAVRSAATAGRRKKALELVNEFLGSEPNIADAWILRSHLAIGLNEKIESLQRALEIDPENATARSAYDFLTATVGSGPVNDNSSELELNRSDDVESSEGPEPQPPTVEVADFNADTDLIEMPLDGVFDLAPSEFGDDRPSDENTSEVGEYTVPMSEAPRVHEPAFAEIPFDATLAEESSDRFENTFLEAFDTSGESEQFESEVSFQDEASQDFVTEAYSGVEYTFSDETPVGAVSSPCVLVPEEPLELSTPPNREDFVVRNASPVSHCPYCEEPNEPQAFLCISCKAGLSLSDIESLLHNSRADRETIQTAVTQMEAEWNLRDFSEIELIQLGVGYLNLGEFDAGMKYIHEASRLDPNNVILAGQLNAIAIRLDEMRRQNEINDSMPKGKTILVVDDSATVRKLISSKLEKSGHNVVCAEDGVEALELLENYLPDLVLLDISMPKMDGYEVCKRIRNNPEARELPVVMISGKDGFFDKVRGRMAGSTGYVTKPFGPETLMKALETYLLPEPVLAD